MNIAMMIQTGLKKEQAKRLASVHTANEKEVVGTCVFLKDPDMETLSADIRAIGREVELITRKEVSAQPSRPIQHFQV